MADWKEAMERVSKIAEDAKKYRELCDKLTEENKRLHEEGAEKDERIKQLQEEIVRLNHALADIVNERAGTEEDTIRIPFDDIGGDEEPELTKDDMLEDMTHYSMEITKRWRKTQRQKAYNKGRADGLQEALYSAHGILTSLFLNLVCPNDGDEEEE